MKKHEVVHQALQAALDSWNWRPPSPHVVGHPSEAATGPGLRTELSTTVFSGEAKEWLRYLSLPTELRFEPEHLRFACTCTRICASSPSSPKMKIRAGSPTCWRPVSKRVRKRLEDKPKVLSVFDDLIFANARRGERARSRCA